MTASVQLARPPVADGRTVLVRGDDGAWVESRVRTSDRLRAWLSGRRLDNRLAAGEPPEHDRTLAVRAAWLTTPSARAELADAWDRLAARTRHSAVPVARVRLDAAADQVAQVADLLRSARPVTAGGVAAARLLVTCAGSPVSSTGSGDLSAALARAIAAC